VAVVSVSGATVAEAAPTTLVLVAGGAFLADQVTKALVVATIPLNAAVAVDPHGWIILRHVGNCGGAGGLIPRLPLIAYVAMVVMSARAIPDAPSPLGLALTVGGGLGNIVSLAVTTGPSGVGLPSGLLGIPTNCVVDFLQAGAPLLGATPGLGAGIMNVADIAVGAGWLLTVAKRFGLADEDVLEHPMWWPLLAVASVVVVELLAVVFHVLRIALTGR
jgi:lipoprotein signal peptidase